MSSSGGATTVCAVPVGESRAAAGARRSLAPVEALALALLADIGFAHIETEGRAAGNRWADRGFLAHARGSGEFPWLGWRSGLSWKVFRSSAEPGFVIERERSAEL